MITKKIHITKMKAGDTVLHLGYVKTLSETSIKRGGFMGDRIWGDSYQCGSKPVIVVIDMNKIKK
jgi:hypothetical protein